MMCASLLALLLSADAGAAPPPDTKATMHRAFEALVELTALTSDPQLLQQSDRADTVDRHLTTLSSLKHAFPEDARSQEPATAVVSSLFSTYAAETQTRFRSHQYQAVALRVRTLTGLCFTCHTREAAPASFADVAQRFEALKLTALQRAQLLAATRQFDTALTTYQGILQAPLKDGGGLEYSRALHDAVTLLVRVKDDPEGTTALLNTLVARSDLPAFTQETLRSWQRDVAAWKAEGFRADAATPAQLMRKAQALMKPLNTRGAIFGDERQDILYLRASAYLNLALGKDPHFKARGEALKLLGVCAGALQSPFWWDLDLLFFERCIRENPKTKLAKQCFEQLSDRLYLGFTGSGGTFVPDDELARLKTLRALAE